MQVPTGEQIQQAAQGAAYVVSPGVLLMLGGTIGTLAGAISFMTRQLIQSKDQALKDKDQTIKDQATRIAYLEMTIARQQGSIERSIYAGGRAPPSEEADSSH